MAAVRNWGISFRHPSDTSEELFLGSFFCAIYLSETVLFLVAAISGTWWFKKTAVFIISAAMLGSCVVLVIVHNAYASITVAVFLGAALALSSLFGITSSMLTAGLLSKGMLACINQVWCHVATNNFK